MNSVEIINIYESYSDHINCYTFSYLIIADKITIFNWQNETLCNDKSHMHA